MKKNTLTKIGVAIAFIAGFHLTTSAQNTVGNSGFSEASKAPRYFSQIERANGWGNANGGTVDFYHKNSKKCSKVGIPSNGAGSQDAFKGEGYAGIIAFLDDEVLSLKNGTPEYIEGYTKYSEFLTTKLSSALTAGKTYAVKFRISLSENSGRAVSGLGAYLSKEMIKEEHNTYIKVEPQIKSTKVIDDKGKWIEVSGNYTAKGGEEYLTIGLFNGPDKVKNLANGKMTNNKRAYYYIDGVEVGNSNFADRDGDGIADSEDECPDVKGTAENNGCLLSKEERMAIKDASAHIYFETGSSVIKKESYPDLDKLVAILKKHPEVKARVEGHTDNTGSSSGNLKLSKDRAKSVADYLVSHGEPADHISSEGYGETRPIASNDTKEGRAKNRRVAIEVSAYEVK